MSYKSNQYNKLSLLLIVVLATIICSCSSRVDEISFEQYLNDGNFTQLQTKIDSLKKSGSPQWTNFELDSLELLIHAIRRDFSRSEQEIKKQLQIDFPLATDSDIINWEKSGQLEMRVIDGEKRYFRNAVPNLQRLLTFDELKAQKDTLFTVEPNSLTAFRLAHTKQVIEACNENTNTVLPQRVTFAYTLTVRPNAVPDGETVRCWLPAPREGNPRQINFQLLESNPEACTLAPNNYLQRTFYMEKKAVKDEPTEFSVKFSMETRAQYFDLKPENIQPYDTTSEVYRNNTAERPPHIVFSPEMVGLAGQIVGNETNPLKKAEAIYTWISNSIPWASALEYGTIPNIPHYVLSNRHGDCGMHTLLFMTLARSQGIPVKWQSGFMLHPGFENLHDWAEVYYEGIGWVPLDQSFKLQPTDDPQVHNFYFHGIDAYRLIVNDDYGRKLYPEKKHPRSEPYDFQRGEMEWNGGNLYFDQWSWDMDVTYQ
ncbi:transglutaminase domain-containing protein [Maribellus sp. YY47]|uniref:transglutaminase domain-containing protein n=1 Tax=Maribellus sp. YY47 TaxID=2929486 RepID=UPI002000D9AA|nr:transglutaminase domain-containing protein [Maribellus sp. YY47]MCK3683111.1 transglutaminase domain-containing protein [Maribellus sp. YY47]